MRIAFVDGGPALAAQLARTLDEYGLDWEVAALDSAEAAEGPAAIDVLVSGLPTDPAARTALAALRDRHPDAVRVLLLEPGQEAGALGQLDGAHRVLQKPLDADELINTVEGIVDLRDLLDSEELKRYVGRVDAVPAAPRMYFQLARLIRDPEIGLTRIAGELSQDPALVARVLRLCNSAYFSAGREVTDVRSAVTRLGLQTVHQVVLASETFGHAEGLSVIEREFMQDRALRISRLAAKVLPGSSAEQAATAGLLVEVGRLLPPPMDGGLIPDYAQAGAYLLGLWGLPMPIVEAVAFHRQPQRMHGTGFWITGALHVAAGLVMGDPLDEAYLQSVGMLGKVPQWQALMEQDMARAA